MRVSWPDATGLDGVLVYSEYSGSTFVTAKIIAEAMDWTYKFRIGFRDGNFCYALPIEVIDSIRLKEFGNHLRLLLNEEEQKSTDFQPTIT